MSKFNKVIASPVILTEGSVVERLRRDDMVRLDPWVEHAGLVLDSNGRAALERIYRGYLDIGKASGLPMIVFTPTWRTNPERVAQAGFAGRDINTASLRFLAGVVDSYGSYSAQVLIGGLIGCHGDAYRPEEALPPDEAMAFHRVQITELAGSGVDFLFAATLPEAGEAEGIARSMAETQLPYALSFVIDSDGDLLDGTPLPEAVNAIERSVRRQPAFFMVNCVHPLVFRRACTRMMMSAPNITRSVIGLQANTSPRSPRELDGLAMLETEDPDVLAESLIRLALDFGLRILGGCCGTDDRHIARLAARASVL